MIEKEWTQFTRTGRVEDYLAYSKVHEMEARNSIQVQERFGQEIRDMNHITYDKEVSLPSIYQSGDKTYY